VLAYDYGTAYGISDACSRVALLIDNDGSSAHLTDGCLHRISGIPPGMDAPLIGLIIQGLP